MENFWRGMLTSVGGAANKYGQIQSQQRDYNIEQQKIKAETARKENFEYIKASVKRQNSPSGMVDAQGRSVYNDQLNQHEPGSLQAEWQVKEDYRAKAKAQAQEEARGSKYSKFYDVSGNPLTNEQLETMNPKDVRNKHQLDSKRQGLLNDAKSKAAKKKEDAAAAKAETLDNKKLDESFRKDIARDMKQTGGSSSDKLNVTLSVADSYQNDPRIEGIKSVQQARKIVNGSTAFLQMRSEGIAIDIIYKEMLAEGYSKKDIASVEKYLVDDGQLEKANWRQSGKYKGKL